MAGPPKFVPNTETGSKAVATKLRLAFYDPQLAVWRDLKPHTSGLSPEEAAAKTNESKSAAASVKEFLLSSLQMQHVVLLAGSGTSLGSVTKGPSMWSLWDHCINSNPESGEAKRTVAAKPAKVIGLVKFDAAVDDENIEALLSKCEAYLQIQDDADVKSFVKESKSVILQKCSEFIDPKNENQLQAHRTFLHRLSRRRVRDSRLKLFTTNYDLCFETAAGRQGLVVLDGFSFTQPRHFDPRFFSYDIVRRSSMTDDVGTPVEGVFLLYKLHGSVNWGRSDSGDIQVTDKPTPENVCMIFPANGKYQQSYAQPHLESVSQYLASLREPNTCLIVIGFGFNDEHLSEPILAAVRTNPHLRLIIVNPYLEENTASKGKNRYWGALFEVSQQGEDIRLVNASFQEFAELIPDLKSLTPAERLAKDIKRVSAAS
jgi:hypothetical protein